MPPNLATVLRRISKALWPPGRKRPLQKYCPGTEANAVRRRLMRRLEQGWQDEAA
jgi:hypothetical protein